MDHFDREQLRELTGTSQEPCVSLFMPTFRAGREVRQNAIRFKNLLKQTVKLLSDRGMDDTAIDHLLADAHSLERNDHWWQHQSDGLAVFVASEQFHCYRVPLQLNETVMIGSRFHVRPMIRLLQGNGHFYVLAVSQNRVRLFEGTRFSVSELDPEGLPTDLRSAMNIDEYTDSLQQHSTGSHVSSGNMMFHGHGGSDMDVRKSDEILPFFRRISSVLSSYLGDSRVPLVFVGVDYLFPIFKQASDHKGLVSTPATGNPDELTSEAIHEQAWKVVEPIFRESQEIAWDNSQDLNSSDLATDDLVEILRAAVAGQIDTLLFADDKEQWGVIDERSGNLSLVAQGTNDGEELINYVAVHTLLNGGTIYELPASRFDNDKAASAVLRYPLISVS